MKISETNISYNNFSSRKLFCTSLFKKTQKGIKKPIKAFITELMPEDLYREDLSMKRWRETRFGENIILDFYYKFSPQTQSVPEIMPREFEVTKFFAVEVPCGKKKTKTVALGEIKVRDDFVVLDRLQSFQEYGCTNRLNGTGSSILYSVAALAEKMKKSFVTLESCKEALGFYKKIGMTYKPNNEISFFKLYHADYDKFLKNLAKKFNITSVTQ